MNNPELASFSQRVSDQLFEHILPFWCGPALDPEQGGWMGWLTNDLKPDRSKPKGLIVHCRILWTFSAVHRVQPDDTYHQMAERAFGYVMNRFWDCQHGGVYWRLDDRGNVLEEAKKSYGQAFFIYALAEYCLAFNSAVARERATHLYKLLERHVHDAEHEGYFEVASCDWSQILDEPLSERDQTEKKSMNTHLHLLEGFTNLFRIWKDPVVEARLRELLRLFTERILDPRTSHLHHFFDEGWNLRSDSYIFGHDIEASWLLCEAAEMLGDAFTLTQSREVALRLAQAVLEESVQPDGSLVYEGREGRVIDQGRESWPQAEAVVGFLNAFQISGDPKWLAAARQTWEYIEHHLVDRVRGEWFWRITPEGTVDDRLPKVSEWKGPYHATRACLEAITRLKKLSPRS